MSEPERQTVKTKSVWIKPKPTIRAIEETMKVDRGRERVRRSTLIVPEKCKFLKLGYCSRGSTCAYFHQFPDHRVVWPQYQVLLHCPKPVPGLGTFETLTLEMENKLLEGATKLAAIMHKDMKKWVQSNMWPFSSYRPIANGASVGDGFTDISIEEVRLALMQGKDGKNVATGERCLTRLINRYDIVLRQRRIYAESLTACRNVILHQCERYDPSHLCDPSEFLEVNSDAYEVPPYQERRARFLQVCRMADPGLRNVVNEKFGDEYGQRSVPRPWSSEPFGDSNKENYDPALSDIRVEGNVNPFSHYPLPLPAGVNANLLGTSNPTDYVSDSRSEPIAWGSINITETTGAYSLDGIPMEEMGRTEEIDSGAEEIERGRSERERFWPDGEGFNEAWHGLADEMEMLKIEEIDSEEVEIGEMRTEGARFEAEGESFNETLLEVTQCSIVESEPGHELQKSGLSSPCNCSVS